MSTRKLGFVELMTAIYGRLTTHALTKTYSFFNDVPENTPYPYHVTGKLMGVRSAEFDTKDTEAEDNIFHIDSYVDKTSGEGDKACADMQDDIIQALTSSVLAITGDTNYNSIRFVLDYAEIMLDPENPELLLRHGVLRFRIDMSPS